MKFDKLILIIILVILLINLFTSNNIIKITSNIPKTNKKSCIVNKEPLVILNNKKKVTFNLDNNKVYEIKKYDKNIENYKNNYFYGEDIINNNKVNKDIKNIKIESPQQILVNRLYNEKDDIQNTKDIYSYWDNLNIGNFTDRQYLNTQVNNFNDFKSNNKNFNNKEISRVFDDLTNGKTNTLNNLYDDDSIKNSDHIISGISSNCKYHNLNNIEN